MNTEQIAEHLHGRRIGDGYTARCPGPLHAHGDRHPSLRITEGRNGRTLIKCFAGCDVVDIVTAARLRLSDLFTDPGKPRQALAPKVRAALADLSRRLTKRERALEVTVLITAEATLDLAIARSLALAVEQQEIVQIALEVPQ